MGYRIIYGKEKRRISRQSKALIVMIAVCAALIAAACFVKSEVQLPGEALERMVQSVQAGESLSDAVTAFCREIVDNAKMLQ